MGHVLELAETLYYSYRTLFDGVDLVRAAAAAAGRVGAVVLAPSAANPLPPAAVGARRVLVLRVDASG